jgi:type IV secretory pathway VirB2 component (pilin)
MKKTIYPIILIVGIAALIVFEMAGWKESLFVLLSGAVIFGASEILINIFKRWK